MKNNTLKRQGYTLTHSYGHGRKGLACVRPVLMMMAFAMDKIEELCCPAFREALAEAGSRTTLWRRMLSRCDALDLQGWEHPLHHLAGYRTRAPPAEVWMVSGELKNGLIGPVWGWKSGRCNPLPVPKIPGKQKACP